MYAMLILVGYNSYSRASNREVIASYEEVDVTLPHVIFPGGREPRWLQPLK